MNVSNERENMAEAVATLFGALSDDQAELFEQLCYDAGLLWRCTQCGWNVAQDEEQCPECQAVAWRIGGQDRREGYGEEDPGDDGPARLRLVLGDAGGQAARLEDGLWTDPTGAENDADAQPPQPDAPLPDVPAPAGSVEGRIPRVVRGK
jgi:hypothetical protein